MAEDFEDELLALAGGGGGEFDQEHNSPPPQLQSPKLSPSHSSPPRPSIETAIPQEHTATPTKKMAKAAPRRKRDESEEEGEASPPPDSPQSYGSAAMEESESEEEDTPAATTAKTDFQFYPLEGKFRDAADKERIMALPEIERERILAEREEDKIKAEQLRSLQGAVMAADTSQIAKKRKATVAGLDDAERKATRPKTKRELELEHLKKSREDAKSGVRRDTTNRRRRSSTPSSQKDADGESEVEFDETYRAPPREQSMASAEELQRIRVGREQFAQYSCYPPFEELTTESFVRVQVADGKYKMAQIKGYEVTKKPYRLEPPNARPYYSDQYVTVAAGEWKRSFPLTHCSNSKFTVTEIEEWKRATQDAGHRIPTSAWAKKKCEDLHALINFHFGNDDITKKLAKQNKFQHLLLAEMQAKHVPKVDVQAEQQRRVAEANRKKKIEADEAMRAANAAKKARQRAAAKEAHALKIAERKRAELSQTLGIPKSNVDDLFEGGSDLSRTATPQPGEKGSDAEKEKKKARETVKGIPTFTRKKMDDEIIGAIDLGIDLEI